MQFTARLSRMVTWVPLGQRLDSGGGVLDVAQHHGVASSEHFIGVREAHAVSSAGDHDAKLHAHHAAPRRAARIPKGAGRCPALCRGSGCGGGGGGSEAAGAGQGVTRAARGEERHAGADHGCSHSRDERSRQGVVSVGRRWSGSDTHATMHSVNRAWLLQESGELRSFKSSICSWKREAFWRTRTERRAGVGRGARQERFGFQATQGNAAQCFNPRTAVLQRRGPSASHRPTVACSCAAFFALRTTATKPAPFWDGGARIRAAMTAMTRHDGACNVNANGP